MKILIADDYSELANLTKKYIETNSKYKIFDVVTSSADQLRVMEEEDIDVIISDDMRKNEDISGMDIILKCEEEKRKEKFILITGTEKDFLVNRETRELPSNVIGYLKKPIDWKMLIDVLQKAEEKIYA